MRRHRFRKPAVSISLFPFLAVLVCTMGVLIVLLVIVVQQARAYASQVAKTEEREQQQATPSEDSQQQFDNYRWRREVLETQRTELAEQLADQRLELSHLEEHIRRLEQRWQQLRQEAKSLDSVGTARASDAEATRRELARLQSELEAARRAFQRAQQEAAQGPRSFAIIPYEGPNGTRRRPIYIECTDRGIVLQPEGVVLEADDFAGPLGPGNPLDASLRTIRAYLARMGDTQRSGEPYPLLIVRPDGAVAYAVARAAMMSWDEEFGYELVESDLQLAFPPPDPVLRAQLERAVRDARSRQSALAAAMPSQFRNAGSANGFVASPTRGGFVPQGGADPSGGFGSRPGGGFGSRSDGESGSRPLGGFRSRGGENSPTRTASRERSRNSPGSSERGSDSASTPSYSGSTGSGDRTSGGTDSQGVAGNQHGGSGPGGQIGSCPVAPIANTEGVDWALPKATPTSTGILRPIYIACLRDQLVILPEKGDPSPYRVIAAPGRLT